MALIAFVYLRAPGSSMEMAKVLSFTIIPVFLIGPIAGVYVDRWDRRRTMYTCDFLRAALVLTIPLFLFYARSLVGVYLVIFLVFSIGRFFVPAKMSIIPELVEKKDLLLANSLVNVTGMIAAILGFGASGMLIEWLGARSGFYLDSLSFFISAALIFLIFTKTFSHRKASPVDAAAKVAGIGRAGLEMVGAIRKSVFQEVKEGIGYFLKQKEIRFTAGVMFILFSALGGIYTVLIVFVQKTLHSATKDLGFIIMCLGVGFFSARLYTAVSASGSLTIRRYSLLW